MKRLIPILIVLLATAWARGAPANKPTGPVEPASCVTAECHADVKQFKVVHGPVNVNACDACHRLADPAQHRFELARPKAETCTFCHQVDVADMPVVHKPVADGECLSCHNPHGGTTAKFIRGDRMDQLCNQCHEDVMTGKANVHGPVAAAACSSCHAPHAAAFPNLLAAEGRDLCLNCHTEMKQQMTQVKFQHKAVEQDCVNCHDAHASNFPMQTKQAPLELCTSCHEHEPVKQAALSAKNKHSIVTSGDACLNCHTAHGGDLDNLMRNDQLTVCMKCHNQPIQQSADNKIAAVSEVMGEGLVKHGPIRDGSCGGCHNVHGSDVGNLLAKNYPAEFYQPFALEKYELCFTCHDNQLVLTEKTTGLTKFRNGEANLHYLHVNKSERGRNCRACHNAHASPNPLHVRSSVPYGNWEMPINFAQNDTGGTCAPGCHKPYAYDRDNPVTYGAPAAGAAPAPAAPEPAAPAATQPTARVAPAIVPRTEVKP